MTERRLNRPTSILVSVILFAAGLFIGLVILGWWLWPVNWTDSTPENLNEASRIDYLRATIDSYTYNQDAALATARYNALGTYKESTLATVYNEPVGQTQPAIAAFAAAVNASEVLVNPPPTPEMPAAPGLWDVLTYPLIGLCLLLLFLVGLLALFFILRRRGRPAEVTEEPSGEFPPAEEETFPVLADEQAVIESEAITQMPIAEAPPAEPTPTDELPDWLQKPAVEKPTRKLEPEELVAAGAVAAMGVAAVKAFGDENEPEPEPIPEITPEDFASKAVPIALSDAFIGTEETPAVAEVEAFGSMPAFIETTQHEAVLPFIEEAEAGGLPPVIETAVAAPEPPPAQADFKTPDKFIRPIEYVEGIGENYGLKLREIGITVPLLLLKAGATEKGRREVAEKTGISEKLILKWVNQIDLYRIKGIAQEYADLLETAGVDTVKELALRNPEHLHQKLLEINQEMKLVRRPPALSQVEEWIAHAKKLPRAVSY